jgi:hypothetical protein
VRLLREGNERPTNKQEGDKNSKKPEKELISFELLGDLTGAFLNCGALFNEKFAL